MQRVLSPSLKPERRILGLTKTGRISKAKKGKPVHDCSICGKTYTRAEHLRRHQLNHRTDNLRCDYPSCHKVFHREDLLARHKERHELDEHGDLNDDDLHVGSSGSGTGASSFPPLPSSDLLDSPFSVRPRASTHGTRHSIHLKDSLNARLNRSQSLTFPPTVASSVVGDAMAAWYHEHNEFSTDPSPAAAPGASWHPSPVSQASVDFDTSHLDLATTDKGYFPMVDASAAPVTQWLTVAHDLRHAAAVSPFSEVTPETHSEPWPGYFGDVSRCSSAPVSLESQPTAIDYDGTASMHLNGPLIADEFRDALEAVELGLRAAPLDPLQASATSTAHPLLNDFQTSMYLESYWAEIHNRYPLIHRPSFNITTAVPLLKASILALGAQCSQSTADQGTARALHERCLKVVKKRVQDACRSLRICDMQAMFFIELFAQTKARRMPKKLSRQFHHLFQALRSDNTLRSPAPLNYMLSLHYPPGDPTVPLNWTDQIEWIRFIGRQRLLAACYVLESQQSVLYPRAESPDRVHSGVQLPFPMPQKIWDTATPEAWNGMICHDHLMSKYTSVYTALRAACAPHHEGVERYDSFQSAVLIAASHENDARILEPAFLSLDPWTHYLYHAYLLCQHVPTRALLAVSGESWILGEKLGTAFDYTQAREDLRRWTRDQLMTLPGVHSITAATAGLELISPSDNDGEQMRSPALDHALAILRPALQPDTPSLPVPFADWCLYIASLTVWALGYAVHQPSTSNNVNTSGAIGAGADAHAMAAVALSRTHSQSSTTIGDGVALGRSKTELATLARSILGDLALDRWDSVVPSPLLKMGNGSSTGTENRNETPFLVLLSVLRDRLASHGKSGLIIEARLVLGQLVERWDVGDEGAWF